MRPDLTELWGKICLDDDAQAFERLYYALFNKLIKFSVYYVHQREVAEEIVSEVFVKCWNNRKSLSHIDYPESYLFIAVKNQSLKYRKKYSNIHLVELEDNEFQLVDLSDPSKKLERKELHHRLDQAIEMLPMQARIVFRLIKENGLKYKEVAEILSISPRTVQTQLFRAIDKLRQTLKSLPENSKSREKDGKILNILIILFYFFNRL
ncbi:RNA polymerase sigma-70 factor (ECF subfamily) [Mucilaginibacter frigoritolerans]|uniref:RNA polymerase sigma-70 factor (ECF subfamily) n=1 Tax=Mucilaginibacter frigoritolerans TaxID=652788 RepID=A0A562U784_9SPHI|nr:RNA polymerase sigma-70 factor [Mucilaginibacter frigoritolerans]TWJ01686.1 RNA polymerase sigma-70 factor (ECF subfamily) [Mucilaginibacter frigoritolerans]